MTTERRENQFTMMNNPVTLIGHEVKVGEKAPDFTVLKNDLTPFSLKDAGDKIKIISVVPSLDTGVCEAQTVRFNGEISHLPHAVVLTISVDLPFAQTRFCETKNTKNVLTLSDYKELDFGLKYGFVMEELRLLARGIVVLDRDNTVTYVEYVKEQTEAVDFDKALAAVKALA